jgi:DNA-binding transcriptional LysR family regulator
MRVAHAVMTLAQLQALVAVAECGSFTAAAARLSLTQPGVSRAVASLERELGVALLVRDGAGAVPTAAGDEVLVHARTVLAGAERLRQTAGAARGTLRGRVRIGAFQSVATRVLPARIAAFTARHPGVEVTLLEGTDDEVLAWLERGAVDVATVVGADRGVPLVTDVFVAMVPPASPLAQRPELTLADLAAEPFILCRGGCDAMVLSAFAGAGLRPRIAFEALETATVAAMAAQGLGVSLMPTLAVPEHTPAVVRPLVPRMPRAVALAHRGAPPPALAAFLSAAG